MINDESIVFKEFLIKGVKTFRLRFFDSGLVNANLFFSKNKFAFTKPESKNYKTKLNEISTFLLKFRKHFKTCYNFKL